MDSKTIFLDTHVIVRTTSDANFAKKAVKYFTDQKFTIIIPTMTLIELYRRPNHRLDDIAGFLSQLPFAIARNPDGILENEILAYPDEIPLPRNYDAIAHQFSPKDLEAILDTNMKGKIAQFDTTLRPLLKPTQDEILKNRNKTLPDNNKNYSDQERENFLLQNVLRMVYQFQKEFLTGTIDTNREIDIKCFKAIYIQVLAIFMEYYVQKKNGKVSDIGDFYQLSYVPYVDIAVLDKERHDLVKRINKTHLFSKELHTWDMAELKQNVG